MRAKYGNVKTVVDGVKFDSKKEARRGGELALLERAGEISELKLQPKFELVVNGHKIARYVADFAYRDKDGKPVVEDVKGVLTPEFKLKAKLMRAIHGVEILLT